METKEKIIISEQEQAIPNAENITAEKTKKKFKIKFPKLQLQTKIIVILSLVLIIVVAILLAITQNKGGQLTTISKSSLQKVIEINELSTVDYTYNATATKYDEDNDAMYYVAYEGTVTAGIDFNEIGIDVLKDEKKVIITIPAVEIHSTKVDMGTMEYIFTKNRYETEDISQEAYKLCKDDLKERIEKENVLHDTARENAISSVEALFKPWIDAIDSTYTVEINWWREMVSWGN